LILQFYILIYNDMIKKIEEYKLYKFEQFNKMNESTDVKKEVTSNGTIRYYNSNYGYVIGEYHRLDGPAVEFVNGDKQWWLNGKEYNVEEWEEKIFNMILDNPSLLSKINRNEYTEDVYKRLEQETDYGNLSDQDKEDIGDIYDVI
jgi:hypothetical protein